MSELVLGWYQAMSTLYAGVAGPLGDLARNTNLPALSALLFGLLGSLTPCQLTTNASALSFISRDLKDPARTLAAGAGYVAGKATVYLLVGLAVVVLGLQLQQHSIPVVVAARKILGPLMLLLGLSFLGLVRISLHALAPAADWLERRAARAGQFGPYLLGLAFSFAFCPTLFLLFFGLTIPLAVSTSGGVLLPPMFALGTTLPLLVLVLLLALGAGGVAAYVRRATSFDRAVRLLAGSVLILAGINDTFLYWFL